MPDRPSAIQANMPHDDQIGQDANGEPSPNGRLAERIGLFFTRPATGSGPVRRGPASNDNHRVRSHGSQRVRTGDASQQAEVDQHKRRGEEPVEIAGPEDLAAGIMPRLDGGISVVVVRVANRVADERGGLSRGGSEVCQRGDDGGQGRKDVVDALGERDVVGQEGERAGGDGHKNEARPQRVLPSLADEVVVGGSGWYGS
jgi:hypothetical protein